MVDTMVPAPIPVVHYWLHTSNQKNTPPPVSSAYYHQANLDPVFTLDPLWPHLLDQTTVHNFVKNLDEIHLHKDKYPICAMVIV